MKEGRGQRAVTTREKQDDMGCGEALLLKFLLASAPGSPPCTYYPPSFPLSLRSAMWHMYLKCRVCSFSHSSAFFSSPVLSIKFTWYPNCFNFMNNEKYFGRLTSDLMDFLSHGNTLYHTMRILSHSLAPQMDSVHQSRSLSTSKL